MDRSERVLEKIGVIQSFGTVATSIILVAEIAAIVLKNFLVTAVLGYGAAFFLGITVTCTIVSYVIKAECRKQK